MDDDFIKARHLGRIAKQQLWSRIVRDPNIAGAGFGRRVVGRAAAEGPALVVYVLKKLPLGVIPPSLQLPRKIYVGNDPIEVDVVETGPFFTQEFTSRERPAPSGISIGHPNITAGTLGCLVNDNTDGALCILSNNHVLADANAAAIGDASIQPGDADGGSSPGDDIGTLKRFITVDCAGTNRVDAAIAQVNNPGDVVAQFKDNLMPYPNADHQAIGLLFAGGGGRTLLNPIRDVISLLNISFLSGGGAIGTATIDMAVEKVGRTTEYTTGRVMEIDVTSNVGTYQCGNALFDGQIATCDMSCGGDSGSLVCAGGSGECVEMDCGCGTSAAATRVFGLDISIDRIVEKEFRERHLSRTLVGKYLMDVFFRNENQIVRRARDAMRTKEGEAHRAFAQSLHEKYATALREALLQPDRSQLRLTSEHLEDAQAVLARARPYMSPEEVRAAEEGLRIARTAVGKTVREILDMLNDKELHDKVVQLVKGIPNAKTPDCGC
jgi:hypothetical protein